VKKLVIGFMSFLSVAAMAKEGGNGGGAFVCRNTRGQILSAELVDFYEGKTEYKLTIQKIKADTEDQVNKAVVKYLSAAPEKTAALMESVQNVQTIMNIVPNAKLENTNDFNLRVAPKTCPGGNIRFEQLANYTDDGKLTVDKDIHDALSNTDKAGLILHEALYLLARKWQDVVSSREARRLTAHLFSTLGGSSISKDILDMNLIDPNSNKKWLCSALMTQAEFKKVDGCPGILSTCLKKVDVKKEVLSSYASTLFKAQASLDKMVKDWNPYTPPYHIHARQVCGTDSATTIIDAISDWDWRSTSVDTKIDCHRAWSPNFDCKEL
jgi:hypothetical protein